MGLETAYESRVRKEPQSIVKIERAEKEAGEPSAIIQSCIILDSKSTLNSAPERSSIHEYEIGQETSRDYEWITCSAEIQESSNQIFEIAWYCVALCTSKKIAGPFLSRLV